MIGKRVYADAENMNLQPGEYAYVDGRWYGCTPNGHLGDLTEHQVTEHNDSTITVSPSILVTIPNYGNTGKDKELWHGYLEAGVWREV